MNGKDWFFAQISDLQFGMFRPGEDDYEETDLVIRAMERLNDLKPDFVLCTGDIIDATCSDRQMDHARELLKALDPDIPFIPVPGNHDIGDTPTTETLNWFRGRFGRDRMSFDHRGWHFIGLNSCLLADGSAAPDEEERQWAWLEEDLRHSAMAAGVVVFMHHPLFLTGPDEEDGYFNLPRSARGRCLELLVRHGVRAVFCGHLHRSQEVTTDDCELVVTGPVGMPLQDGYSGLRLVRAGAGGLKHRYFGLEDEKGQREFVGSG